MAEVLAQSKIIIELSDPAEIEAFAELLTEVKDAYIPKNMVGLSISVNPVPNPDIFLYILD